MLLWKAGTRVGGIVCYTRCQPHICLKESQRKHMPNGCKVRTGTGQSKTRSRGFFWVSMWVSGAHTLQPRAFRGALAANSIESEAAGVLNHFTLGMQRLMQKHYPLHHNARIFGKKILLSERQLQREEVRSSMHRFTL